MRHMAFRRAGLVIVVLFLILAAAVVTTTMFGRFFSAVTTVVSSTGVECVSNTVTSAVASSRTSGMTGVQSEADTDTAGFEATIKNKDGEHVKIRIDERGISIEGGEIDEKGVEDTTDEYPLVKEKGTDIVKFGEDVYIARDERIRGDLVVFGGDVWVDGIVGGNVVVIGGDIDVRATAEIKGDAVVLGGDLDEEAGALIRGERVTFKGFLPFRRFPFGPTFHSRVFDFFFVPVKIILSLIISFLIILFLKGRVLRSENYLAANILKCFGIGFLILFVGGFTLTVLTILLCITIIGIPLGFLLVVSSIGVMIFAWTIAAYTLGEAIRKKLQVHSTNAFLIVFIGTLMLFLPGIIGHGISMLPVIYPVGGFFKLLGFFVTVFAELAGLGALFLSRFGGKEFVSTAPVPVPTPETT